MLSRSSITILAAVFLLASTVCAAELTGVVIDSQTGEPVPGAMIKLADHDNTAVSNSQGEFRLQNMPSQTGQLIITHLAYEVKKQDFSPPSVDPLQIELKPKILKGQDVIVTATRAQRGETPATFSNRSREEIEADYWSQDTPMLLASMPNIFSYSDAGNGIGYSYLKLRGFNQNRVSVMINGIPLNGAESHEVYWVDLPDFANNVQDIQVQRGVGTSLYGQSALGGSVNMITNDFSAIPELKAESGYGSFNTRKLSVSGNSGLIKDSYVFYGRYSKIQTDGYRDNSWVNMYSYFIGAAKYDKNMTWRFNTYGGPEELHLAYKGIPEDSLSTNRKYNELQYENEIDHFNQPHYELMHDWTISDRLKLANTLYYFNGEGYYNQFRRDQDLATYNLGAFYDFDTWNMYTSSDSTFPSEFYANLDTTGQPVADTSGDYAGYYQLSRTSVDLIRKPWVKEYDWGWIPRLTINHNKGAVTIGGEMRIHASHHWGEITWAEYYPNGYPPNIKYHDYRGKSNTFTTYVSENYRLSNRVTIMANLQYQRQNYHLEDDKRYNVTFDRNYDFFSPRFGVIFKPNANINIYLNSSTASRQPAFQDIYDPQDYWSNPEYRTVNFILSGNRYEYIGKGLKPERLFDQELGSDFTFNSIDYTVKGEVNLYYMQVTDELVPYSGQLDDMNVPITGNADKTIHQGIELAFNSLFYRKFSLRANLSINDDHFDKYTEYDWDGNQIDLSGNRIGGFPRMLANYELAYKFDGAWVGLSGRYIGKQYIDNAEQYQLDPYHLVDAVLGYDFGRFVGFNSLKANLRLMNLTNVKYEQSAYIESDDSLPRYIVGAERNVFLSLAVEF